MSKISVEEVNKIAKLSKLDIGSQAEKFSELLSDTLNYIQVLEALNTDNVSETYQVTGLCNVYQTNQSVTLDKEESLKNASHRVKDLFGTSAVFDRE